MREQEHNYEVYKVKSGFKVVPRDETRPPVYSVIDEHGFWNIDAKYDELTSSFVPDKVSTYLAYDFYNLVNATVSALYRTWKRPEESSVASAKSNMKVGVASNSAYTSFYVSGRILQWAEKNTSKSLNHVIKEIWLDEINNLDKDVRGIHKTLFALTPVAKCVNKNRIRKFIDEHTDYLLKDFYKYKALQANVAFGGSSWFYEDETFQPDWMKCFSSTGEVYTSLARTLMNLPNNLLYSSLEPMLKRVTLPEPATSRVRLMAYLSISNGRGGEESPYLDVVRRSSDDDLKKALMMVNDRISGKKSSLFRSGRRMLQAFSYIYDYDGGDIGRWKMTGLAKRSMEYHDNIWKYNMLKDKEKFSLETAKPPIPLPENPHVRFLSTFGEVVREGSEMHHCIAGYGKYAVNGHCYLFHVDYKEDKASVQIDESGILVQARGISNASNKATRYAEKALKGWCEKLKEHILNEPSYEQERFERVPEDYLLPL